MARRGSNVAGSDGVRRERIEEADDRRQQTEGRQRQRHGQPWECDLISVDGRRVRDDLLRRSLEVEALLHLHVWPQKRRGDREHDGRGRREIAPDMPVPPAAKAEHLDQRKHGDERRAVRQVIHRRQIQRDPRQPGACEWPSLPGHEVAVHTQQNEWEPVDRQRLQVRHFPDEPVFVERGNDAGDRQAGEASP